MTFGSPSTVKLRTPFEIPTLLNVPYTPHSVVVSLISPTCDFVSLDSMEALAEPCGKDSWIRRIRSKVAVKSMALGNDIAPLACLVSR